MDRHQKEDVSEQKLESLAIVVLQNSLCDARLLVEKRIDCVDDAGVIEVILLGEGVWLLFKSKLAEARKGCGATTAEKENI